MSKLEDYTDEELLKAATKLPKPYEYQQPVIKTLLQSKHKYSFVCFTENTLDFISCELTDLTFFKVKRGYHGAIWWDWECKLGRDKFYYTEIQDEPLQSLKLENFPIRIFA